jgi:hypothetical protein
MIMAGSIRGGRRRQQARRDQAVDGAEEQRRVANSGSR